LAAQRAIAAGTGKREAYFATGGAKLESSECYDTRLRATYWVVICCMDNAD